MVLLRYSLAVFVLMVGTAQASTILQWTFDGATNPADLSNSAASPNVSASTGTGTASGLHASALTDWTTPVGNGTTDAFSSTNWGGGDYYQFTFSTAGFINLSFAFDQTSSATGPKNFKVQTSTGSGYSDLGGGAYAVLLNGTPNPAWTSGTVQPAYHYSFALPGGTAGVRLIVTDNVAADGGTIGAAGTDRVDTVTISGDVASVPEPASLGLALVGLAGLVMGSRRRVAH